MYNEIPKEIFLLAQKGRPYASTFRFLLPKGEK